MNQAIDQNDSLIDVPLISGKKIHGRQVRHGYTPEMTPPDLGTAFHASNLLNLTVNSEYKLDIGELYSARFPLKPYLRIIDG